MFDFMVIRDIMVKVGTKGTTVYTYDRKMSSIIVQQLRVYFIRSKSILNYIVSVYSITILIFIALNNGNQPIILITMII